MRRTAERKLLENRIAVLLAPLRRLQLLVRQVRDIAYVQSQAPVRVLIPVSILVSISPLAFQYCRKCYRNRPPPVNDATMRPLSNLHREP
jgi:hypothetical protein